MVVNPSQIVSKIGPKGFKSISKFEILAGGKETFAISWK